MNRPAGALFDLDGVLIDTEGIYTWIWTEIEANFPTGISNFAQVIKGNTLPRILEKFFHPEDHRAIREMLKEHEDEMDYPVFPGVMDFLHFLCDRNIPTAIVTSSGDLKMELIRRRNPEFMACFSQLITDSMVERSKPDPDPYIKGAQALGVDPHDCVVFEDSFSGLESGRAAGATVVALSTTNPAETLLGKADYIVPSLGALLTLSGFCNEW